MKAVGIGVERLLIGTLRTDGMHADGSPAFIAAMNNLLQCQEGALSVEAPAISYSSAELIRESRIPPEVLAWAHSCHVANEACGECRGCRKHYETLEDLGLEPY
jgi:7-cyano-7-deazaguanine synthase